MSLPPILLPRLTACLAVSSVILGTLRRRLWLAWFYGFSAHALFTSTVIISWSAVCFGFGYCREPSVSAVVSVMAITGLQIWCHFWLWPKPEKVASVGLYSEEWVIHFMQVILKYITTSSLATNTHVPPLKVYTCNTYTNLNICYQPEHILSLILLSQIFHLKYKSVKFS